MPYPKADCRNQARGIVTCPGGTTSFTSESGMGTTFVVRFVDFVSSPENGISTSGH